jgi:hypothetical protein
MSRWLVLTACSSALLAAGCAPSLTPGLANGPRLGGSQVADERIGDVVSNGNDACGPFAEGSVLRNKVPECPTVERSASATALDFTRNPDTDALVVRWLRHFYVGWPCKRVAHPGAGHTVAWVASNSSTVCNSP